MWVWVLHLINLIQGGVTPFRPLLLLLRSLVGPACQPCRDAARRDALILDGTSIQGLLFELAALPRPEVRPRAGMQGCHAGRAN